MTNVLGVAVLFAAALVAWRNVRLGRGDTKAAWRIAAVTFAAGVATWALVASHVPTIREIYLLDMGLSWAAFQAGLAGLLYLAVEPFVRRYWPDALISWMRVVGGRFRDPLAASHVLVGVSAGLVFPLLNVVRVWAMKDLIDEPGIVVSLSGARFLFGILLSGLGGSATVAVGVILVLALLRRVVRPWVADAIWVVVLSGVPLLVFWKDPAMSSAAAVLQAVLVGATTVWLLRRFGLLALVASAIAVGRLQTAPLAVASWYAAYSLTTPLLIATVAAWSLYVILTSRPGRVSRSAADPLV